LSHPPSGVEETVDNQDDTDKELSSMLGTADVKTVVVAMATAAVTAAAPAAASAVVDMARNSDKVDGKHAVAASASVRTRKGKLVATSPTTGRLPNNIIAEAPDAARLAGVPASRYVLGTTLSTAGSVNHSLNPVHWTRLKGVPEDIADGDELGPRAFAHVSKIGAVTPSGSIPDAFLPVGGKGIYCFDVDFEPELVLVTPDLRFSVDLRSSGATPYASTTPAALDESGCPAASDAVVTFRTAVDAEVPQGQFFVAFS
jgi:hypothetical protein